MISSQNPPVRGSVMFRMLRGRPALVTVLDYSLVTLIVLNVAAAIIESVDSIASRYHTSLYAFDVFSVTVFTIEYLVRLWNSPKIGARYRHPVYGRLRWAVTPLAIVDLLAVLPFYLSFVVTIDLRFLRVLRLVRIFKLTRYSTAMSILLEVFREERPSFGAALFILSIILIVASSGIYLVEQAAQPEAFGSIPSAMWWAMATLTTVGYGDVTPITVWGKLFGALVTVVGIGMVALPAGILASGFSDQLRRRREKYRQLVEDALEDGKLTKRERRRLSDKREELGINPDDARRLRDEVSERQPELTNCPHCGRSLTSGKGAAP